MDRNICNISNFSSVNPDEEFICPYDPVHKVIAKRFPYHVMKCRKNWNGKTMLTCIFNARHIVPASEHKYHINNCPDKAHIEADLAYEQRKQGVHPSDGNNTKGFTQLPQYDDRIPSPTEDWDEEISAEPRMGYNPSNYPGPPVFQNISGYTAGEKRDFHKNIGAVHFKNQQEVDAHQARAAPTNPWGNNAHHLHAPNTTETNGHRTYAGREAERMGHNDSAPNGAWGMATGAQNATRGAQGMDAGANMPGKNDSAPNGAWGMATGAQGVDAGADRIGNNGPAPNGAWGMATGAQGVDVGADRIGNNGPAPNGAWGTATGAGGGAQDLTRGAGGPDRGSEELFRGVEGISLGADTAAGSVDDFPSLPSSSSHFQAESTASEKDHLTRGAPPGRGVPAQPSSSTVGPPPGFAPNSQLRRPKQPARAQQSIPSKRGGRIAANIFMGGDQPTPNGMQQQPVATPAANNELGAWQRPLSFQQQQQQQQRPGVGIGRGLVPASGLGRGMVPGIGRGLTRSDKN